ncbi:MAG TPA: pyridine nucleotide-disulfide oxidoreductase [Spirochaetia bacterium]|nr:MAG: pyridine nucleotide-disulfide oxidoreductase [Spirochaetes bacterium GWB1_36_13]HCL57572.1 pyridine nucleotide-disulfide oxidoreductase [Spirochaetia bacterium]
MEKTDVLVIGGSAAGIVAALTGKSNYPEKEFMVVRKEKQVVVPCGIPYIFGSLENSDKNLIPDAGITGAGIKLKIGEAVSLDTEKKICQMEDGSEIQYEKIVLAMGSNPSIPSWLKGSSLENVFTIPKNKDYLDKALVKIKESKNVVVIGAGFIGVEMSDEINKMGKNVTLVEILPNILGLAFDSDIALKAEELLKSRGVNLKTNIGVKEIVGNKKAEKVILTNGEELAADAVILSMGYTPNTQLVKNSKIKINEKGCISVDEYMRTDIPDVFAIGDCAEKRDFFTRKMSGIMLASTATSEARIAGMNLYTLSAVKTFGGTIAIFSTALGDTGFGAAGLTEKTAKQEGFNVITGSFEGVDKHPGTLTGTHKQMVKLIAASETGTILGGEVSGGASAGELINIIGLMIQNKMTIGSILTAQIGTHPLLTAPPTAYPIIKAAEIIAKKMRE